MRKYLIGGNWKCNGTLKSNKSLVEAFNSAGDIPKSVEVVVGIPCLYAYSVLQEIRSDFQVAVQNIWSDPKFGAYTGETSASQVKDLGINWTIIGHSERRYKVSNESDEIVSQKLKAALSESLKVIVCIGELKAEREAGRTMEVCLRQLRSIINAVDSKEEWENIVIAYEPVWAIGTGLVATTEQVQEVHMELRKCIERDADADVASGVRIIYGGSVNPGNCCGLIRLDDVDGFLVGGASLKPTFMEIVGCVTTDT